MSRRTSSGPFGLLAYVPPFRRLWIGEAASVLGDRVTGLALPLTAVVLLHAGPMAMGYLTAAGLLPFLVLSLPVGVWLDRRGRRRQLMIVSDIGRAVLLLSVPLAFLGGWLTLGQVYWVAGLVGVFEVVFDLSYPSLVTSLVGPDDYLAARPRRDVALYLQTVAVPDNTMGPFGALSMAFGSKVTPTSV